MPPAEKLVPRAKKWFDEGWSFQSLDSLTGKPNRLFREWLTNPSYVVDYWDKMVPYKEEFGRINIPVLTITGYYDADQLGALNYYKEHLKYNPAAPHYLIIGPYDHFGAQGRQVKEVYGYPLSEAAQVNFYQVVFGWFDYVLKNKKKPTILKDKVNYQIMGTNTWKAAPTLAATSTDSLKFYLSSEQTAKNYKLAAEIPANEGILQTTVNFRDRKKGIYSRSVLNRASVISKRLKPGGMQFVSAPLEENIEITGCFHGELNVLTNKKDFDVMVELFELREDGSYLELSHFLGRASYVSD